MNRSRRDRDRSDPLRPSVATVSSHNTTYTKTKKSHRMIALEMWHVQQSAQECTHERTRINAMIRFNAHENAQECAHDPMHIKRRKPQPQAPAPTQHRHIHETRPPHDKTEMEKNYGFTKTPRAPFSRSSGFSGLFCGAGRGLASLQSAERPAAAQYVVHHRMLHRPFWLSH